MTPYAAATARRDRRGQHYAAEKARRGKTVELAKQVFGPRSKRTRNIKAIMGMK